MKQDKSKPRNKQNEYIQSIPVSSLILISSRATALEVFLEITHQHMQFFETLMKPKLSAKAIQVIIKILEQLTHLPLIESRNYFFSRSLMFTNFWDETLNTMRTLSKSKKTTIDVSLNEILTSVIHIGRFVAWNLKYSVDFVSFFQKVRQEICVMSKSFSELKMTEMASILKLLEEQDSQKLFIEVGFHLF